MRSNFLQSGQDAVFPSRFRSIARFLWIVIFFSGCAGLDFRYIEEPRASYLQGLKPPSYPRASFIVISDPHFFAPALWEGSPFFRDRLVRSGKMFDLGEKILNEAAGIILSGEADFILVPGDLTKDGERESHLALASWLRGLEEEGFPVYVIPGNHDILNPDAERFAEDAIIPAGCITPKDFSRIYGEFGYEEALFRDASSLSYVAEPVEGLWLLALDSCIYEDNLRRQSSSSGGALRRETVEWAEEILMEAARQEKAVMAMLHHGILEHYPGQRDYAAWALLDDFEDVSRMLAFYNVRLVFTGHYHAQDITLQQWPGDGKFIFDIETGSLLTYPCPVRKVSISAPDRAEVKSTFIAELDIPVDGQTAFEDYAENFIREGAARMVRDKMMRYDTGREEAEKMTDQVADAFVVHIRGDESSRGETEYRRGRKNLISWLISLDRRGFVEGLRTDLPPADNNIRIYLDTGAWEPLPPDGR